MVRLNVEKRSKQQIQRSLMFKAKLLEYGMLPADVASELNMDRASISKYSYGDRPYLRGRVRAWAVKKFGELFVEELDRLVV